ncbi:MAG: hypothetical protein HZA79_16080 [Sphingobacteriales bacterium]|nr:hypothetical protein [Sphingobacteriales bacterium]
MKQLFPLLTALALVFAVTPLGAQPPAGFKAGYIITADGIRQDGFIKENFKSKASFVFQTAAGKKTTYGGNAVNEVNVEGVSYVSYANDFFKVVRTGAKASLLQKVSDATGKVIYNGTEAAGISSGTEGRINDTFIKTSAQPAFTLVNKDNLNEVISDLFPDCPAILSAAKAGQFQYNELENVVTRYNECK